MQEAVLITNPAAEATSEHVKAVIVKALSSNLHLEVVDTAAPGHATEVASEVLRHTYFAYLIRQGARLADIGEFIGRIPPAAFREYGRLSPLGPGLPLERIDPVFPALRMTLA